MDKKNQSFDASPTEEIIEEPRSWKEKQYEKLRGKLSVKVLDILIAVLVIAFITVVVIGFLKGSKSPL